MIWTLILVYLLENLYYFIIHFELKRCDEESSDTALRLNNGAKAYDFIELYILDILQKRFYSTAFGILQIINESTREEFL